MSVGDDVVRDADAALFEAVEKFAPVNFGFGEGGADPEDDAFAVAAAAFF